MRRASRSLHALCSVVIVDTAISHAARYAHPNSFSEQCMRRPRGMSVVELTIAIGVVALVASVAVPTVDAYLDRGKAAHAIGDIGTISVQLYRWQSNSRKFPQTLAEAGLSGFVDPWGNPYKYVNVATA